jgi:predicted enzyme related to lactoylglutathione lyase
MPRVVHFEFTADDPERAEKFWAETFGWKIQKWEGNQPYWLVSTGEGNPGIDGGIMGRPDFAPGQATICTLDVDSVDDVVGKVEAAGGSVVVPKIPIPDVGYLAYCKDTEGTVFGVMQSDSSAGAADAAERPAATAG